MDNPIMPDRNMLAPGAQKHVDETAAVARVTGPARTPGAPGFVERRAGMGQPRLAVTPGKLWQSLWHRRWLALLVGLILGVGGAALAWFTETPKFTAVALLRVTASESRILPGAGHDDARHQWGDEFRKTQALLVKSRPLLQAVLKQDTIRGMRMFRDKVDPASWLEKELQTGYIKDTDILRVALTGEHPDEIAVVVNAVKDQFLQKSVDADREQQLRRVSDIEKVYGGAEEKVRDQRVMLRHLAESLKTTDTQALTLKQRLALEAFGDRNKELTSIEVELRRTKAQLAVHRSGLKHMESQEVPASLVSEAVDQDPVIQKLIHEINHIEFAIEEHATKVKAGSPRLAEYDQTLKNTQAKLEKARLERRPKAAVQVKAALTKQKERTIYEGEERQRILISQHEEVAKEVARLGLEAEKIGTGSFELEMMRGELDQSDSVLKSLRAEKERLKVELQVSKERIHKYQDAEVPQINQSSLIKIVSLYSVGGLLGGFFLIAFIESRFRRVHKPSEVRSELGIHTLGVLPLATRAAARVYGNPDLTVRPLVPTTLDDGLLAESVDSLRNALLCSDQLHAKPVIMITSSSQFEGKTFLSTHLAASLARAGRKTLLLDCDLRKPSVHDAFDLPDGPGLCEVLRGEIQLADAIQNVPGTELSVLRAGQMDSQVAKALNSGEFRQLLRDLREAFDCVVVDSAPTLIVSDTLLVGKQVDAVILVVRPKVSRAPLVSSAFEQMRGLKIPVLGAVINGVAYQSRGGYYHSRFAG